MRISYKSSANDESHTREVIELKATKISVAAHYYYYFLYIPY